ncbi:MAG: YraN family protein [Porcipelethomonas sp.]
MRKNNFGREGELAACAFAESRGLKILRRNFKISGGEADIIAADEQYICFIEVKFRGYNTIDLMGSVDRKKQLRVIKAAERYILETGCRLQPRFDVIIAGEGLSLEYIENAYGGPGI